MALIQRVFAAAVSLLLLGSVSSYAEDSVLPDPKTVGGTPPSREAREASNEDGFIAHCTDAVFPNDIVCDMRQLNRYGPWLELQPMNFTKLRFDYEPLSYYWCSFSYKPIRSKAPDRFVYGGFECIHDRGNLPEPTGIKTSDFKEVSIVANKPDNESYQCTFTGVLVSKFQGRVKGRRFNSRLVKYRFKSSGCVLAISIGREALTTAPPPCVRDRRGRCRPNRN